LNKSVFFYIYIITDYSLYKLIVPSILYYVSYTKFSKWAYFNSIINILINTLISIYFITLLGKWQQIMSCC